MKKYRRALYCSVISLLFTNATISSSSFASTRAQLFTPSKAGRVSTVVANTILSGVTPPKSSDGIEGDFYIDTKAMLFYGPKAKTHWPSPISMRGPQGQAGPSGSNGLAAKPSANVIAAGAQGLTGAIGPKGEQGVQGIQGSTGPAGPKGESGSVGPAGGNGASGANGIDGAPGPTGPQGSAGAQGAPGANGANGATGSVGPSNAYYGPINFAAPIQGVAGTSQASSNFGTFEAHRSYVVWIQIQTFNVDRLISTYPLAFDVVTQGASPQSTVSYSVANGSSFNLSTRRDEVSINAEVILDGSQIAGPYALSVTITCGTATGSFPVTVMGRYHAILVGQVTQTS